MYETTIRVLETHIEELEKAIQQAQKISDEIYAGYQDEQKHRAFIEQKFIEQGQALDIVVKRNNQLEAELVRYQNRLQGIDKQVLINGEPISDKETFTDGGAEIKPSYNAAMKGLIPVDINTPMDISANGRELISAGRKAVEIAPNKR